MQVRLIILVKLKLNFQYTKLPLKIRLHKNGFALFLFDLCNGRLNKPLKFENKNLSTRSQHTSVVFLY